MIYLIKIQEKSKSKETFLLMPRQPRVYSILCLAFLEWFDLHVKKVRWDRIWQDKQLTHLSLQRWNRLLSSISKILLYRRDIGIVHSMCISRDHRLTSVQHNIKDYKRPKGIVLSTLRSWTRNLHKLSFTSKFSNMPASGKVKVPLGCKEVTIFLWISIEIIF